MKACGMLRIRELPVHTPDAERIYAGAREACLRFNAYLQDFIETASILRENRKGLESAAGGDERKNLDEYLLYMDDKIRALCDDMERIAGEMPDLVELVPAGGPSGERPGTADVRS